MRKRFEHDHKEAKRLTVWFFFRQKKGKSGGGGTAKKRVGCNQLCEEFKTG